MASKRLQLQGLITFHCKKSRGQHRYCHGGPCTCWCHTSVDAWLFDGKRWRPLREISLKPECADER